MKKEFKPVRLPVRPHPLWYFRHRPELVTKVTLLTLAIATAISLLIKVII